MQKIKVLHIIKTLDLGGAETNLFNLINDKGNPLNLLSVPISNKV